MKDKIVTRLVNFIINIYGKLFKFDCPFKYNTDQFEYVNYQLSDYISVCYITWSFLTSDMHEKLFIKYLQIIGLKYEFSVFIMSLLHEVGHHKVGDVKRPYKMINITQYKDKFDIKDRKELDLLIYYNVPDEYEASKWAVNFANNHVKSLTILSYLLYPLINYTYNHYWDLMIEESNIYVEKK